MSLENLSDEEILARVALRDTAAHEALYDRYAAIVLGLALKITGDRSASEEVVQETFWRIWRRADSFEVQRGAAAGWLFSIARNLAIDVVRRRGRAPFVEDPEGILESLPDPATDVADAAVQKDWHRKVRDAIAELPPEQRKVIEMAYFGGLSRQEIAQSTGASLGTIHSRTRLAMQKLREALLNQGLDE